jgi:hypothetical protein
MHELFLHYIVAKSVVGKRKGAKSSICKTLIRRKDFISDKIECCFIIATNTRILFISAFVAKKQLKIFDVLAT